MDDLADDEPLATAARASASFPVAFAPVRETSLLRKRRVWPDWATGDTPDWLADGGILEQLPIRPGASRLRPAILARPPSGSDRPSLSSSGESRS